MSISSKRKPSRPGDSANTVAAPTKAEEGGDGPNTIESTASASPVSTDPVQVSAANIVRAVAGLGELTPDELRQVNEDTSLGRFARRVQAQIDEQRYPIDLLAWWVPTARNAFAERRRWEPDMIAEIAHSASARASLAAKLAEIHERMRDEIGRAFLDHDAEFHSTIHVVYREMLQQEGREPPPGFDLSDLPDKYDAIREFGSWGLKSEDERQIVLGEHALMIAKLQAGDSDGAWKATAAHLRRAEDRWFEYLRDDINRRNSEWFEGKGEGDALWFLSIDAEPIEFSCLPHDPMLAAVADAVLDGMTLVYIRPSAVALRRMAEDCVPGRSLEFNFGEGDIRSSVEEFRNRIVDDLSARHEVSPNRREAIRSYVAGQIHLILVDEKTDFMVLGHTRGFFRNPDGTGHLTSRYPFGGNETFEWIRKDQEHPDSETQFMTAVWKALLQHQRKLPPCSERDQIEKLVATWFPPDMQKGHLPTGKSS